ncbi:MAG: hypothetical protein ACR2P0_19205 [Acidimicrobiales bacterium]
MSEVPRFRIGDISPEPTADVIAAITIALDETWPAPSRAGAWEPQQSDATWRFSQRPWVGRQVPLRRWGRA